MFEKIVYNLILDFISDHNVLYDHQYGFRKGRSTQHAIITLVDKITKSQDMGDIVIAILIDLKKAFDTVDHKILLRKLNAYGIRGNMLKWFESYLSNRTQYVVFDGEKSDTNSIKCGVPQGSILGPLLFILSVNDICNVSPLLFKIHVGFLFRKNLKKYDDALYEYLTCTICITKCSLRKQRRSALIYRYLQCTHSTSLIKKRA